MDFQTTRQALVRARKDWFVILGILVGLGVMWLFLQEYAPSLVS